MISVNHYKIFITFVFGTWLRPRVAFEELRVLNTGLDMRSR